MGYLPVYYVSSALFVFAWLTGFVAAVDVLARELDKHISSSMTIDQWRKVAYWQIGILLVAFVGFKWVVLTSYGDGYRVFHILSGHGSDTLAYPFAITSIVCVVWGMVTLFRLLFGHFRLLRVKRGSRESSVGL